MPHPVINLPILLIPKQGCKTKLSSLSLIYQPSKRDYITYINTLPYFYKHTHICKYLYLSLYINQGRANFAGKILGIIGRQKQRANTDKIEGKIGAYSSKICFDSYNSYAKMEYSNIEW